MDLGIKGKQAIVCASSQGLGKACATSLAGEGCEVVVNGRDEAKLLETAREIEALTGAKITPVVADITTDEGRKKLLASCPKADILVNNNAGPPPGKLEDWDHAAWIGAMEANFLPAALLIRGVMPGMRERKFGRIVNITSAMVKSPYPEMGLSTAARAGLSALSKSTSRLVAPDNVTLNNMLPYRIDTDRQRFFTQRLADQEGIPFQEARRKIEQTVAAQRMGTTKEFGDACAFLCSVQAGFISGQNLQLDGASYFGLI
ncbi:MAG: SDR family oxidoreductase [Bradyrhizobium sp.]|nr:SDR family oxidoreductase [Bradyrhizobium sp.]